MSSSKEDALRDLMADVTDECRKAREAGYAARCDDAIAQGFADCESLASVMGERMAARLEDGSLRLPEWAGPGSREVAAWAVRSYALAIALGQHRSAETNETAVLSAHRTAVNRAQAHAGGRASAAKRWGPKGAKP